MTSLLYTPNLTDVNRPFALLAAGLWDLGRDNLQHIADFGNSVYLDRLAFFGPTPTLALHFSSLQAGL